jgi:ABC-type transport system substrate-binding protein
MKLIPILLLSFLIVPGSFTRAESPTGASGGGAFTDSLGMTPLTLVPFLARDAESMDMASQFYLPLFEKDGDTLKDSPVLASKVVVSKDRKETLYELNSGARWSDGTPVTSDDVEFTFRKIMDPKVDAAVLRGFFEGVTFRKVDGRKFSFQVAEPKFNTLSVLNGFTPVQKKQFEKEADLNKSKEGMRPVGNSPYVLKSLSRDQVIVLERMPGWWGDTLPSFRNRFRFKTLVFRIIADPTLRYEKLVRNEIDTSTLTSDQYVNQVKGVDSGKFGTSRDSGRTLWADRFKTARALSWAGIAINLKHPWLASLNLRKALAHLVNYEDVIQKGFMGTASRCVSPFGSSGPYVSDHLKANSSRYSYDPKKARELLLQDGFRQEPGQAFFLKELNGKVQPLRFVFKFMNESPAQQRVAQILKESFKKAGIDLELRPEDPGVMFQSLHKKEFELAFSGWGAGGVQPDPRQLWASSSNEGGSNYTSFINASVDEMIRQANVEFNEGKREKLLQKIGDILYEQVPYVFLMERDFVLAALHSRIQSGKWIRKYGTDLAKDLFYE